MKVYKAFYENYKVIYPFYKFDIGDKVRIVKKKKTFKKGYTPNWTEELFEGLKGKTSDLRFSLFGEKFKIKYEHSSGKYQSV